MTDSKAPPKVASLIALLARRGKLVEELAEIDAQIEANWTPPPRQKGSPGRKQKYPQLESSVIELTRSGQTQRQISEELGMPHQSVAGILRRHGVKNPITSRGQGQGKRRPKTRPTPVDADDEGECSLEGHQRTKTIVVRTAHDQKEKMLVAENHYDRCLSQWMLHEVSTWMLHEAKTVTPLRSVPLAVEAVPKTARASESPPSGPTRIPSAHVETRGQKAVSAPHSVTSKKEQVVRLEVTSANTNTRRNATKKRETVEDSATLYRRDVGKFKLLSPEEEISIAKQLEEIELAVWRSVLQGNLSKRARSILTEAHAQASSRGSTTELHLSDDLEASAASARTFDLDREHLISVLREIDPRDATDINALCSKAEQLRARFAQSNLRLVMAMAARYRHSGITIDDLIQEGNLGLMHAVPRFDWRRGLRFSTFASWWIRSALNRACMNKGSLVRLPVHVHDAASKARNQLKQLTAKLGRAPTDAEISKATGLSQEERAQLESLMMSQHTTSLDTPLRGTDEGAERSLLDTLSLDETTSVEDLLISEENRLRILAFIDQLPPQEADILRKRFGFDGNELTLAEVGALYGVSRERIRQIEKKALLTLRGRHTMQTFRKKAS